MAGEELPEYCVLRIREDNTACITVLTRGWSSKLSHLPTVYGVSVLWAAQRLEEGRVEWYKEGTRRQLADPLTKLMQPTVLFERGLLRRSSSATEEIVAPGFPSTRIQTVTVVDPTQG